MLHAGYKITDEHDSPATDAADADVGIGTAPDFVFAFTVVTVLFFSSFAMLYVWDGFIGTLAWRERGYITLSMISKTDVIKNVVFAF